MADEKKKKVDLPEEKAKKHGAEKSLQSHRQQQQHREEEEEKEDKPPSSSSSSSRYHLTNEHVVLASEAFGDEDDDEDEDDPRRVLQLIPRGLDRVRTAAIYVMDGDKDKDTLAVTGGVEGAGGDGDDGISKDMGNRQSTRSLKSVGGGGRGVGVGGVGAGHARSSSAGVRFAGPEVEKDDDEEEKILLGEGGGNSPTDEEARRAKLSEGPSPLSFNRSGPKKYSFRNSRNQRGTLQRLASMPGDSELADYMDSLAREPDKFTTPHNADTGETIVHLLAKEGKVEILESLLDDPRVEREVVSALLKQDKLGWNPLMAATRADSGAEEIVEMFLLFLETRLEPERLGTLLDAENISKDSVFTLLMRNNEGFAQSRKVLFRILTAKSRDTQELNERILRMLQQLTTPNSCELTSRTMKEILDLSGEFGVDFEELFAVKDVDGNNLLMELAKSMKDDALREILTNHRTSNYLTHSILMSKNLQGQTLLTLIEVNRESLSESLPLVLKREYGCHRRDMIKTEICLSEQLETSASASEIIQELHQLEPKSWGQIFVIWATLFLTSLTPNLALSFGDIFSDSYLVVEYHNNMRNASYTQSHEESCRVLKNERPIPLEAYVSCLESSTQFYYTITFLLIPLIFYLTEFLTLRPEYEPTGLRERLQSLWAQCRGRQLPQQSSSSSSTPPGKSLGVGARLKKLLLLVGWTFVTALALILWQPVTAFCKFYRDARYEASEGTTRVQRRKEKRYVDLAASRGELIEVSIEAVFEPMVQGYIIFPSIIDIIKRLSKSVTMGKDGTLQIEFALRGIETAQIFSIVASMVSLAWCFSEYNSVRKNMLLDITISPCSRIIMCLFMLFQVVARLLAFILFTLYWGPGNFYPLLIFVGIHMVLAATLHVVFSEDIVFWRKGLYLKFFHNVIMNSFASIYFHNYLRFDEMPVTRKYCRQPASETEAAVEAEESFEFIDAQRPGLHISTFLRQLMFDILYAIEYVILLAFGFSSEVKDLIDQERKPIIVTVILALSLLALTLKLFYYMVMHVWSKVILSGKKLTRRDFHDQQQQQQLHSQFFKYVFISRNTWILGRLRHIETTLIVLPKRVIEAIKGRGQDLEYNFTDVTRQVEWKIKSPRELLNKLKPNNLILSLMFFPLVIIVIVINIILIVVLLVLLLLTIPVALLIFFYNLKSGFRSVEFGDMEEEGQNTLELPPEVDGSEATIFKSDPSRTLASIQRDLENGGGCIDLHRKVDLSADELEVFAVLLLSLNRKRYPLRSLILDNCDLTDEKLIKLAPLIVKFNRVTLNGSQKMTAAGWEKLGEAICKTSTTSATRLRVLEMKITKDDEDVIRFRREVLLEELKGSTMTAEALAKIAVFVPRLEKVFLDDIFNDTNFLDLIMSRSDNILEAWKELASQIVKASSESRRFPLRCLSLPGCSINDEILSILAPALVKVKKVHLGRNPITSQGWLNFRNALVDAVSVNDSSLTHLSLNATGVTDAGLGGVGGGGRQLLHCAGMEVLAPIMAQMEEVDLTGQVEVGAEGWTALCTALRQASDGCSMKLKTLVLAHCKVKGEVRTLLEETAARCNSGESAQTQQQHHLRVEYGGRDDEDGRLKKRTKAFFCF